MYINSRDCSEFKGCSPQSATILYDTLAKLHTKQECIYCPETYYGTNH